MFHSKNDSFTNLTHFDTENMVWGGDRDDFDTNCLTKPCTNAYNLTNVNHHFLIQNWDRDENSFVELSISETEMGPKGAGAVRLNP